MTPALPISVAPRPDESVESWLEHQESPMWWWGLRANGGAA